MDETGAQIAKHLDRIATCLERMVAAQAEEADNEPAVLGCPHPEERRADLGMTQGMPDWQCTLCGYRSLTPES